jgi:Amt family ammonium transporter
MMFAIITPALITGAVTERMKFTSFLVFIALWSLIVYYPLAHMVWGGGILQQMGAVDFAGGNVVHISSGVSALVLTFFLGKRKNHDKATYHPHNVPFVLLGAALLWFGWFGFNAGSAGAANGLAVHAFMTTNTSAAAAMLSWMLIEKLHRASPRWWALPPVSSSGWSRSRRAPASSRSGPPSLSAAWSAPSATSSLPS